MTAASGSRAGAKRLALIGGNGMLATKIRMLAGEEWQVVPLDLPAFDLTDPERVATALNDLRPQYIVNCAALTDVDGCESNQDLAMQINGVGPGLLARFAVRSGAILVHISTDYVFSGDRSSPYREDDATAPRSVYGRSKLAGEQAILASGLTSFFIVRTSWLYGPGGKNFVETVLRLAGEREELRIVADQVGTPTYTGDLARTIFALLDVPLTEPAAGLESPYGIYHFSNEGQCSWYEFAEEIVALARERGEALRVRKIHPISTAEYPLPAPRPGYSVFSREKIKRVTALDIPHWKSGLATYFAERQRSRSQ